MSAASFLLTLVAVTVGMSAVMTAAWLVWRRTRNSGWVDTIWTFGLGASGIVGALTPQHGVWTLRQLLVAALIAIWSARLGLHIARRSRGITDDPRYAKLIAGWGDRSSPRMFVLLQKQALVSIPLALTMLLAARNLPDGLRLQDALAVFILVAAIVGETSADAQLRAFRAAPGNHGQVCDVGLWRYSRHPNYFFEWLGWIGYALFAIDVTNAHPFGWFACSGPICMYWLLVYVSGIPPLEEHMAQRADFRDYQRRTNAFFPGMPRAGAR
jgi:steroid 5-alpha reductase family enzyme